MFRKTYWSYHSRDLLWFCGAHQIKGIDGPFDVARSRWFVQCPNCSNASSAKLALIGQVVKCKCGTQFKCPWWNLDKKTVPNLIGFEKFDRLHDVIGYEVQEQSKRKWWWLANVDCSEIPFACSTSNICWYSGLCWLADIRSDGVSMDRVSPFGVPGVSSDFRIAWIAPVLVTGRLLGVCEHKLDVSNLEAVRTLGLGSSHFGHWSRVWPIVRLSPRHLSNAWCFVLYRWVRFSWSSQWKSTFGRPLR